MLRRDALEQKDTVAGALGALGTRAGIGHKCGGVGWVPRFRSTPRLSRIGCLHATEKLAVYQVSIATICGGPEAPLMT